MVLTPARLTKIPHGPGVYTFTRRGVPLYVGKAADLRTRLRAYLPDGEWKADMVREATGLRVEPTGSEVEALLLEAVRISTLRPQYNVEQRSERSFLSILVTTDEDFPQVIPTRSHRRAGTYVGPFTSARAVRETLRALRKVFPYRCNKLPAPSSQLQAAAPIHNPVLGAGSPDARVGASWQLAARTAKPCLYFHLGLCAGTCAGRITRAAYRRRVIAPLIRVLRGETRAARRLLDPAHRLLLNRILAETHALSTIERFELGGRELQRVLGLPRIPRRIEGYDISHLHGHEAVGSMVVSIDGEPDPSEYKRFLIRDGQGMANDSGMLREVLRRRLVHAFGDANSKDHIPNSNTHWPLPDLILVDGGKAQRNAALRAIRNAGASIPLVALAKREEDVYLPGTSHPLRLSRHSPALQLLQRVRDEAHRFAIAYHRERYRKRSIGQ